MTVSSGSITIQAVISGGGCGRVDRLRSERNLEAERERAAGGGDACEEAAAVDGRHLPHGVRSRAHASAAAWIAARDPLIGAATADVGDRRVDVGVARFRLLPQQGRDRHDHAALAVAALRHVELEPGLLHPVQGAVLAQAFDRGDLPCRRPRAPAASRSASARRRRARCRRRTARSRSRTWCRSGRSRPAAPTATGCRDRRRRRGFPIDGEARHRPLPIEPGAPAPRFEQPPE